MFPIRKDSDISQIKFLSILVSYECIARADVLGTFWAGKYFSIKVQFKAFITKYQILSRSFKLKNNPILIAEKCSLDAEVVIKSLLQYEE